MEVTEREPIPRRTATYPGDQRHVLNQGYAGLVGPDQRGILWLPCHAEYRADSDTTHVRYRPVAEHELRQAITEQENK